jgi:hypothetical protein
VELAPVAASFAPQQLPFAKQLPFANRSMLRR